ncbi:hypothetical protein D3C78_1230960 [compost metagenome]
MVHRFPGAGFVEAVGLHEALQQRRADEMFQPSQIRLMDLQSGQGVLHRAGDALARVGEGAVEVEEDVLVVHGGASEREIGGQGYNEVLERGGFKTPLILSLFLVFSAGSDGAAHVRKAPKSVHKAGTC